MFRIIARLVFDVNKNLLLEAVNLNFRSKNGIIIYYHLNDDIYFKSTISNYQQATKKER